MKKTLAILLAGALAFSAQAQHGKHSPPARHPKTRKAGAVHFGTASFYANKFEGRRTANGEIFTQQKLTGASNRIGLNNWVRVTNLRNHKTVVVHITDRMAKHNERLIDLSRMAAKKLSYTGYGLARVKVEILGKDWGQAKNR